MLEHFRRILLVLVIFFVAGWLYKQWRDDHGGYGLFDLLKGRDGSAQNYTAAQKPVLKAGDMPSLAAFSAESAKLAQAVLPSVVSIDTDTVKRERTGFFLSYQYRVIPGLGSGVIVSKEGHIVTNNHVVAGTSQILVTTNDQKTYQAEVVGADTQLDIAVLKIIGGEGEFPALSFGNSDSAKVGQLVFAVGNPFGLSGTVTQGIISATQRSISDIWAPRKAEGPPLGNGTGNRLLQTDTVINPGNSGGPLVNIYGEIVGINVSIYTSNEKVQAWQGVGLAVPANDVRAAFQSIMEQGPPQTGYLGITLQQRPVAIGSGFNATLGVVVDEVQPNSPAMVAGLRPGDVIAALNGKSLDSPDQVFLAVRATPPGNKITFTVIRNQRPETLTATIRPRPKP